MAKKTKKVKQVALTQTGAMTWIYLTSNYAGLTKIKNNLKGFGKDDAVLAKAIHKAGEQLRRELAVICNVYFSDLQLTRIEVADLHLLEAEAMNKQYIKIVNTVLTKPNKDLDGFSNMVARKLYELRLHYADGFSHYMSTSFNTVTMPSIKGGYSAFSKVLAEMVGEKLRESEDQFDNNPDLLDKVIAIANLLPLNFVESRSSRYRKDAVAINKFIKLTEEHIVDNDEFLSSLVNSTIIKNGALAMMRRVLGDIFNGVGTAEDTDSLYTATSIYLDILIAEVKDNNHQDVARYFNRRD